MNEDTRTSILDAALTVASRHGLARLSLEQVAQVAGVSRQTIYRYVGNREGLLTATILREEEVFLTRMRDAAEAHPELRPALEAAVAEALRSAREHPLLDRLLRTEPSSLLPFLVDATGPVLSGAKTVVRELLTSRAPHLSGTELDIATEASSRLVISYVMAPPAMSVEEIASGIADLVVNGVKPRDA